MVQTPAGEKRGGKEQQFEQTLLRSGASVAGMVRLYLLHAL
ncbi:MAG: hypothetical protein NVV82_26400 [Sporocytophaga sp.]|nr:hypothetical protein [Sporocytophaga sp.]